MDASASAFKVKLERVRALTRWYYCWLVSACLTVCPDPAFACLLRPTIAILSLVVCLSGIIANSRGRSNAFYRTIDFVLEYGCEHRSTATSARREQKRRGK